MRKRVTRFVDRSLPEVRFPDPEDRRRGRVLLTGSMLLTALALLIFINTLLSPSSQLINYIGVGGLMLAFGLVPAIIRLTGNLRKAGMWAVGWAFLLFSALLASGGMRAPALSWLVFMPLVAHFFVGGGFALVVLLGAVATVSLTYGLALSGHDFPISYRGDQLTHLRWLSSIIFAVTCTAIASLYNDARRRALRLQEENNERLQETNRQLALARDQAEAASRTKSSFLATVSHELRTPLHGVLAMTGALQQQELSEMSAEQVGIADRAAQMLNELIEDLLRLSEIEAGALQLQTRPWRLRQAMTDLVKLYQLQAKEKGLFFRVTIDEALPAGVLADPLRVQQVITNLLCNAFKFTQRGGVTLDLTWHPRADADALASEPNQQPTQLIINISDTGPGIPEEHWETVFDPFTRVDNSPTRRQGGTGLGLAISRRLVKHMGGSLTLHSELGAGSQFVVTLPCAAAKPPALSIPATPLPPSLTVQKRVLVADDSVICQQVLNQLLTPIGFEVSMVSDGQAALDRLAESTYDIVLMDCEMPHLDGISAVRLLREREGGEARVPVIAVTAHGLAEHREICAEAGMDDLLSKPFRLAELEAVIGRWLDSSEQTDDSEPV